MNQLTESPEKSLIGAMLDVEHRCVDEVRMKVKVQDFYRGTERAVAQSIFELHEKQRDFDQTMLIDYMHATGALEHFGSTPNIAANAAHTYFDECQHKWCGSWLMYDKYMAMVLERSAMRQIASLPSWIESLVKNNTEPKKVIEEVEQKLHQIGDSGSGFSYEHIKESAKEVYRDIEAVSNGTSEAGGIKSGLDDLDNLLMGFKPGLLYILAARPGMGKSALALNIAANMATNGYGVGFCSLEMPNKELTLRMICSEGRIDSYNVQQARMSEQEWARFIKVTGDITNMPIWLDDSEDVRKLPNFRSLARHWVDAHDVKVIFIDYLQLMKAPGKTVGSREQEISKISRELKSLAKELKIPIIALAQLNRGVEQRADKRPMNSDLRESGAIEQDADIISFIYRDEVYDEDSDAKGIAEIIIGKHRGGKIGTVKTKFTGKYTRFDSLKPNP